MVSGALSLPCSGYFSPFPHGTGSLSVSREYLALPDGPGGFAQNSSCSALLRMPLRFAWLRVRNYHALWLNFPDHSPHHVSSDVAVLLPPRRRNAWGLGSSPFARHYWGTHCYFLFLQVLRCFSSLRSPPSTQRIAGLQPAGLSHSEIRGSTVICTYPRLIAAYHVLHRLREPRHPPCALSYFLLAFSRRHRCLQESVVYFQLYFSSSYEDRILDIVLYLICLSNMSKIVSHFPKGRR